VAVILRREGPALLPQNRSRNRHLNPTEGSQ